MGNPEQQAGDGGGRGLTLPPGGARCEPLFPGVNSLDPFQCFSCVLCETTIWTVDRFVVANNRICLFNWNLCVSCAGNSLSTLQYKTSLDQMFEGEKKVTASLVHTDWV